MDKEPLNVKKDLPDNLIAELSNEYGREEICLEPLNIAVLDILKTGGRLTINEILIAYFGMTGKVIKRPTLYQCLHRLKAKGEVKTQKCFYLND